MGFSTQRRGERRDAEKIASNDLFPFIGFSLCLCVSALKGFLLQAEKISSPQSHSHHSVVEFVFFARPAIKRD
jgi:hypothetical protein